MRIAFLGYEDSPLIDWLRERKHFLFIVPASVEIGLHELKPFAPEWIISYGYRHKISPDIIQAYPKRIINLHISYLPENRGADPVLWTILENTKAGVTLHEMDEEWDCGPILAQSAYLFYDIETYAECYRGLRRQIENLFKATWPSIESGSYTVTPQAGKGSFHKKSDRPFEFDESETVETLRRRYEKEKLLLLPLRK